MIDRSCRNDLERQQAERIVHPGESDLTPEGQTEWVRSEPIHKSYVFLRRISARMLRRTVLVAFNDGGATLACIDRSSGGGVRDGGVLPSKG